MTSPRNAWVGMRCGCENSHCREPHNSPSYSEYEAYRCVEDAVIEVAFVGGLCAGCASYMPDHNLGNPIIPVKDERKCPTRMKWQGDNLDYHGDVRHLGPGDPYGNQFCVKTEADGSELAWCVDCGEFFYARCADCEELIGYDDSLKGGVGYFHVDPDAAPCFLIAHVHNGQSPCCGGGEV